MSLGKSPVVELRIGKYNVCVKHRLAEGGFGYVDLVYDISSKHEYVLKRSGIERQEIYTIVKKEIDILQRFAGPHVVKLLSSEVIVTNKGKKEACLLLELCPGGHLLDRLSGIESKSLPPTTLYRIFGQLLLAMKPLHESVPPVTHRDLKLENILFGSDGNLRLCDFGSCVIGNIPLRNVEEKAAAEEIILKETTQMYRSPELVDLYMRDVLTIKSDIWALGCILYTMCYFLHPFQDMGSLGILNAKIVFKENVPISPDIKTLILRMLDVDPEARPSIAQLLQGFAAIANGKPLPYYVIPAEAVERKKEREITAKKREEKNKILLLKKKPVKVVPFKATGPLDSNSVAARRLAMKKGGNHNIGQSSDNDFSVSQSVENDTIFDTDFSNNTYSNDISTSSTIQKNTPIHTNNSEIFTSTSISTSTFGTSDPWDSSNEFSTITESKNKNNAIVTNLFESFNDDSYLSQSPPSYSSSTIIPIKTSNHGSSFDTGFGSSSASYSNSPPRYSPTKPTSVAADDLFEWSDAEVVSNKSLSPKITKTNSVDLTVFGTSHSNNSNSNDMGNQSFTSTPRKTSQETIPAKENDLFDFDFTSSSSQQSQSLKQSQSFSEFDFPSGNHEKNSIIDFFDTGLPPPPLPSPSPSSSLSPSLSSVSFDNRASGSQFVQSKPVSINSSAPPPKPMKPLPSTQSKVTRPFSTSNIPRQPSIPLPSNTVESRVVSQRLHPTYEVDLFDTTPGPPEIDFLSLENPDSFSSKPSLVFARQQATDVLALFDGGPTDRTNLSTSPRPTFPDLTKGQGLGQGQGLGYSQRSQQQQQQYQQQQQQQQRGFGVGIGLG